MNVELAMNKNFAKWAVGAFFLVAVVYIWIYYNFHKENFITVPLNTTYRLSDYKLSKTIELSNIQRRRKTFDKEMYEKWIVVTSVAPPTDQVKKLSKIEGWKLVVVADTKTPSNWK